MQEASAVLWFELFCFFLWWSLFRVLMSTLEVTEEEQTTKPPHLMGLPRAGSTWLAHANPAAYGHFPRESFHVRSICLAPR